MPQRSVILLIKDERYEFYGSPASLFDKYSANDLAISQQGLNNYFSKIPDGQPMIYKNRICEIHKGSIYVKPTTRGRKKENV